jgi:hypothetical protein
VQDKKSLPEGIGHLKAGEKAKRLKKKLGKKEMSEILYLK